MMVSTSNRQWLAWAALVPVFAFLIIAFDPSSSVVARTRGTVVVDYPKGRFSNGRVTLGVLLPSGAVILASAPADGHYPYAVGASVTVTTYETLISHRKHYEAITSVATNGR
jgi:hypothetical protein